METEFNILSDEESSGALIRRNSRIKSGRNLKENGSEILNMEAEADELVPSLISNSEAVESDRDNCRSGEAKTWRSLHDAEPSEIMCVKETLCFVNEQLEEPGNFVDMISSNDSAMMTMPQNSTEPDKTQPKAKLTDWSVYFAEETGWDLGDPVLAGILPV